MKNIEDALNGIVWVDDALICKHELEKEYADAEHEPGVRMIIRPYGTEDFPAPQVAMELKR